MSFILSVNSGVGSSVGLFKEGKPIICLQEERFSRIKNDMGFPEKALKYVLDHYASVNKINYVSVTNLADYKITLKRLHGRYDDAFEKVLKNKLWDRYRLQNNLRKWPITRNMYARLRQYIHRPENRSDIERLLSYGFKLDQINVVEHHLCHAASAYFGLGTDINSPFLVLTLDGGGDDLTSTVWKGHQGKLTRLVQSDCYSLGNIYSQVTHFLGFTPHEHEYKLMGLAPYVSKKYAEKYADFFASYLDLADEDTRFINPSFLNQKIFIRELVKTFKKDRFDNIAAGLQLFTERIMTRWVKGCIKRFGISNILGSGGSFMNVKVNMLIANLNEVNYIDVFPSCGDESNIFGAAYITRQLKEKNNDIHLLKNYTIGTDPSYDLDEAIQLFKNKIVIKKVDDINTFIATQLAKNKLVARCSGPMEFGARALGNRSILAHPYDLKTVGKINRAVKKRDFWMPFAPAILDQYADQYIDIPESLSVQKSPYMMFGFNSIPEKRNDYICGIHQSDFTTRPIIVTEKRYSDLYKIIQSFREITNIPVLLNTSFNLHGFPIVENSHQAIEVFLKTELDLLVINSTVIWKK